MPNRALAAAVATGAAVVLMASFRTPDQAPSRVAGLAPSAVSTAAPPAAPSAQGSQPPPPPPPSIPGTATTPSPAVTPAATAAPPPTSAPTTAPTATTTPGATRAPVAPAPTARPAPPPTPRPRATPTPVAASGLHDGTWTGADELAGRYGDVQVQLVVSGGRITDVRALVMPTDRPRSAQISQDAGPQLRSEVLQAQSAQIDTVSGATYTSDAYAQSTQAALDQARA